MRAFAAALYDILLTLWVGGLWAIGYLAVPILFAELSDRMLAGRLAGEMFRWIGGLGFVAGGYLVLFLFLRQRWAVLRSASFWLVFFMLAITAVQQLGIQPLMNALKAEAGPLPVMTSALRDRFALWHGVSSSLYLVLSLCGLGLLILKRPLKGSL